MKKGIIIVILGLVVIMLLQFFKNSPFSTIDAQHIHNISPEQAEQMIKENKIYLLDVRTQAEYDEKHYKNAHLIPSNEIAERVDEVPTDKTVLIHCRSGSRAANISHVFADRTNQEIYILAGFPLYSDEISEKK